MNHEAASLPQLVENLVKNWEVEASFKTTIDDWRTIDRPNYSFAINSSEAQDAENMLKVTSSPHLYLDHPTDIISSGRNLQRHHCTKRIL